MSYSPPAGFHFRVEFDLGGLSQNDSRFQEVSGLSAEIATEDVEEGGENRFVHHLPVRAKFNHLVLKRGYLSDSKLVSWIRDALESFAFKPTGVHVTLLNEKHEPLTAWVFVDAYPVKWAFTDLKAQDNTLVIETLELAYKYYTPA